MASLFINDEKTEEKNSLREFNVEKCQNTLSYDFHFCTKIIMSQKKLICQIDIEGCFQKFRENNTFIDMKIISSSKEIPVHRIILARHSKYFAKLFKEQKIDDPVFFFRATY